MISTPREAQRQQTGVVSIRSIKPAGARSFEAPVAYPVELIQGADLAPAMVRLVSALSTVVKA